MKNKTIVIIGIASYILSVITSATDLNGNFVSPNILIAISGIATIIFIVMATIRLWKEARYISVILASSAIILFVLTVIQEVAMLKGSSIIVLLNAAKVIYFIAFVWTIVKLFKTGKPTLPSTGGCF